MSVLSGIVLSAVGTPYLKRIQRMGKKKNAYLRHSATYLAL